MTASGSSSEPPAPAPGPTSPREAMAGWMEDIAPYGIFTTDSELRIRSWNQWLVTHSGLPKEVVLGRALVAVFPEVGARRLDEHFRRALKGEVSVLSTALHKYLLPMATTNVRDSTVPHMLQTARVAPLHLGEHETGTITLIEDVTQRESQALALHRQQEKDRLLSSALAILIQSEDPFKVAVDLFPKIAAPLRLEVYFNYLLAPDGKELHLHASGGVAPECRKALGVLQVGEGLSGLCAQLRQPVLRESIQRSEDPHVQAFRRMGMRVYADFPLLIGDQLLGTLGFGSYDRDTIAPDELEFLATISQYVAIAMERALRENALRQAEGRLSQYAGDLETKIAERTSRLHETIAQLESFSYTVAHDLRAPIRALKGYCEVLLSDYGPDLPAAAHNILERLQRASVRLDALTRDLLIFSKISRQDVELAPIEMAELIQDIVLLTPALQEDVLVVHPPLYRVWGQRTLLQQCLSNLFDNALKFVAAGATPRIVVRCELRTGESRDPAGSARTAFNPAHRGTDPNARPRRKEAGLVTAAAASERIRIWVEDNGIGIHPEAHEKIFGIFERGSGLEHVEGTGIGLAIVARAVEQMGGNCGVESEAGRGSRFWLEFPAVDKIHKS
jgi:signal transduction histidine kinase